MMWGRLVLPLFLAATMVPFHPGGPAPQLDEGRRMHLADEFDRMIFYAGLEGLYEDGVSNEAVDIVLMKDPIDGRYVHFVYGCPICAPTLDAFRVYRARPDFYSRKGIKDTYGTGLEQELGERLRTGSIEQRLDVIRVLVDRWIRRRLDSMRLTAEEKAMWKAGLEARRKLGAESLQASQQSGTAGGLMRAKSCAVCDGANGACEKR